MRAASSSVRGKIFDASALIHIQQYKCRVSRNAYSVLYDCGNALVWMPTRSLEIFAMKGFFKITRDSGLRYWGEAVFHLCKNTRKEPETR
jgi:hypothetical protein